MSKDKRKRALLSENVDAKTPDPGKLVRDIHVHPTLKTLFLGVFNDLVNLRGILRSDLIGIQKVDRAVDSQRRWNADLDEKVRGLSDHHLAEHFVKFHDRLSLFWHLG